MDELDDTLILVIQKDSWLRLQVKFCQATGRGFPLGLEFLFLSFLVYIFIKVSTSIDSLLEPLLNAKESGGNFWV